MRALYIDMLRELEPHRKKVTSFYGVYMIRKFKSGEEVLLETGHPIAMVKDGVAKVFIYHITDLQKEAIDSFFRLHDIRYGMPMKEFKQTYCVKYKQRKGIDYV